MSELEPDDSRTVTNSQNRAPGEPPRTGPREGEAHAAAGQQAEQREGREGRAGDQPIEGDAANHPDRMGAFAGQADATRGGEPGQAEEEDRWAAKANDDAVSGGK